MNQSEAFFTLDDRPFKRDLETGEILRDPETGELIQISREEYNDLLAEHIRKLRFETKAS
ncbi:MAG: hypothetical protein FWH26_03615 [Oscillospiraceae bacterium]|nr:hypothetical protein [Oscillospiraceae bacterium]